VGQSAAARFRTWLVHGSGRDVCPSPDRGDFRRTEPAGGGQLGGRFRGLSADGTWRCARRFSTYGASRAEVMIMEAGKLARGFAVPPSVAGQGIADSR